MNQDNTYQVVYTCAICAKTHQVDDTNLARIADTFERLGWGNVPEYHHGKTVHTAYCPKCYGKIYRVDVHEDGNRGIDWEDEMHKAWMDEQDSLDAERPGLFH